MLGLGWPLRLSRQMHYSRVSWSRHFFSSLFHSMELLSLFLHSFRLRMQAMGVKWPFFLTVQGAARSHILDRAHWEQTRDDALRGSWPIRRDD